jgi:hypothetical protein
MNSKKRGLLIAAAIFLSISYIIYTKIETKTLKAYVTFENIFGENMADESLAEWQMQNIEALKENQKSIITNLGPKKFVYVVGNEGGYGNRMYSCLSGFVTAIVTRSALIIIWNDIDQFIEEPMYGMFLYNSSNYTNELSYKYDKNNTYTFPSQTIVTYRMRKNPAEFAKIPENYDRIIFDGIGAFFFDLSANKEYFKTFLDHGLVSNKTIQNATHLIENPKLYSNYSNLQKVEIYFQVGFEVAHNILNLLWRPKKIIMDQVMSFYEEHFKGFYVIGLQLRYEYVNWNDTFAFIKCARWIEENLNENKRVKWFISTDNIKNLEKIKEMYPDKVIHANGTINHVHYSSAGYFRALLDLELLSRVDELVITGGSTFGFISVLIRGKYPYNVNGRHNMSTCELFNFKELPHTPLHAAIF